MDDVESTLAWVKSVKGGAFSPCDAISSLQYQKGFNLVNGAFEGIVTILVFCR